MPAHNAEPFIREAIDSVFAQTRPVAEFIVIDDGSTDQTARIAESMGVRVIRQSKAGLSGARNRCVREASQPWVAFIDADDIWEPDKIERLMAVLSNHSALGLITSDFMTFSHQGTIIKSGLQHFRRGYQAQRKTFRDGAAIIDALDSTFSSIAYFLVPSAVMVRRDLLNEVGRFDEAFWSAEDFDCFLRVHARCPIAIVEKVLIRRREHEGNVSSRRLAVALSCLAVTKKILQVPEDYPPAAVAICKEALPGHLRHAGAQQLWAGEVTKARELLVESIRLQPNLRTVLALAASLAPFRIGPDLMSARYYISRRFGF